MGEEFGSHVDPEAFSCYENEYGGEELRNSIGVGVPELGAVASPLEAKSAEERQQLFELIAEREEAVARRQAIPQDSRDGTRAGHIRPRWHRR